MHTFIIHYFIYSLSILIIMISLFTLYDHPIAKGFILGISCVLIGRTNYTGLVCRMFDEDDPIMNPTPDVPHEIIELSQV